MFDKTSSRAVPSTTLATLATQRPPAICAPVDLNDLAVLGAPSLCSVLTTFRLWGMDAYYEGAASFGDALLRCLFSGSSYTACRDTDSAAVDRLAMLYATSYRDSATFRALIDRAGERGEASRGDADTAGADLRRLLVRASGSIGDATCVDESDEYVQLTRTLLSDAIDLLDNALVDVHAWEDILDVKPDVIASVWDELGGERCVADRFRFRGASTSSVVENPISSSPPPSISAVPRKPLVLSAMERDYSRNLRRVNWIVKFVYESATVRRQMRLGETFRPLVDKFERTLLPSTWQFLTDVWRQSASSAALLQWHTRADTQSPLPRTLFRILPSHSPAPTPSHSQSQSQSESHSHSPPLPLTPRMALSEYALPDAWFEACFSGTHDLTAYAHKLRQAPIRSALCAQIQKAFIDKCPLHTARALGPMPNWPMADLRIRTDVGNNEFEGNDAHNAPSEAARWEGDARWASAPSTAIGVVSDVSDVGDVGEAAPSYRLEPDNATSFTRALLHMHALAPGEWRHLSNTKLARQFAVSMSLKNYLNRAEQQLTRLAWTYLLGVWRRSAMLAALQEIDASWSASEVKSRAAFVRLLADVMHRYGMDALADCFVMSGERTWLGEKHWRPNKATVSQALCAQIRRAFERRPAAVLISGIGLPRWPADTDKEKEAARIALPAPQPPINNALARSKRPSNDPSPIHDQPGGSHPKTRRIGDPETVRADEDMREVTRNVEA